MVDKTASGLTGVDTLEDGDVAYIVRSGNSRKVNIGGILVTMSEGLAAHVADPIAAHNASALAFESQAGLASDNVADALDELVAEHYAVNVAKAPFNVHPSNSAAVNMAGLKAAIATLIDGRSLLIPDLGGVINFDTTGGLTGAATITHDNVTVILNGHIKANYSAEEANPAFILRMNGRNIKMRGSGTIEGDGAFHLGGVTSIQFPGLVYVQGANFSCQGLRIRRPPQTAFMVVGDNASICHNHFEGGPITWEASTIAPDYDTVNPAYAGSGHFHIVATGCDGHDFSHNRFVPDEDGGTVVNAIFTSGVAGNARWTRVIGNYCENAWEKLFYGYGDRNICIGNNIKAEAPYGYTDAIRVWGAYNITALNTIDGYRSGIQCLDALGCKIVHNTFVNLRDSGINVQHFTDIAGGFTGTVNYITVKGNYIHRDPGQAGDPRFGVRLLGNSEAHMFGCEVEDNILIGWGTAETEFAMELSGGTALQLQNSKCKNNFFVSCASGIRATRFAKGSVYDNKFYDMSHVWTHLVGGDDIDVDRNSGSGGGTWSLSQATGGDVPTNVRYANNRSTGCSNIGIRDFSFGSVTENYAEGNQWTAKALVGGATLSNAASTTVTHGGIAPHASIMLIPTTAVFATLQAVRGLYASVSTNDFAVATGDGSLAAGTEAFRYKILQ